MVTPQPPIKLTARLRQVCCVCNRTIRMVPCLPQFDGFASHGVCKACVPELRAKWKAKP